MATKFTTETFIIKAKLVHGNKYTYDKTEYKGYYEPVIITCPVHGDFLQKPGNHLEGRGCKKCQIEGMSLTKDEFITKAQAVHGDYYDYSKVEYKNRHKKNSFNLPRTWRIYYNCK